MSAASGTIFTFTGGAGLRAGPVSGPVTPGNFVALVINIGLLGVAVEVTGTYVGVLSVQISTDQGQTYTEIDTIVSMQATKIYTFPQNGPYLYTNFRVSGTSWTSGVANVDIEAWNPLAVPTFEGSGGVPQPAHAPDTFHSVAASAAGNTLVWAPAAGNRFKLQKLFIQPSQDAILPNGGNLIVDLRDGNISIGLATAFFLLKAMGTQPYPPFQLDLGPIGYVSSAIDNVLNVNLSAALPVTAQCRVIVMGTEE